MTRITLFVGGLLSLIALLSFTIAGFAAEAWTALIPLFIGAPIALCGWLSEKQPAKRKLFMHIAVSLALIGFLASASRIPKLEEYGSVKSMSVWAMTVLCFILLGAYLQSFFKARMGGKAE
jgi:hypothetical protein